jgi:hypothetical protein
MTVARASAPSQRRSANANEVSFSGPTTLTLCHHVTKLLVESHQSAKLWVHNGNKPQLDYARTMLDGATYLKPSDVRIQDNRGSEPTPHFLSTVNHLFPF